VPPCGKPWLLEAWGVEAASLSVIRTITFYIRAVGVMTASLRPGFRGDGNSAANRCGSGNNLGARGKIGI
jgi:hypothetical protein